MNTLVKTTKFRVLYPWTVDTECNDLRDKTSDQNASLPSKTWYNTGEVGSLAGILLHELCLPIVPVPRAHVTRINSRALQDLRDLLLAVKKRWDYLGWATSRACSSECASTLRVEVDIKMFRNDSRFRVRFELRYSPRQLRCHDPSIFVSKQEIQDFIFALLVSHPSECMSEGRKVAKTTMEECWGLTDAKVTINNQISMSLL